MLKHRGFPGRLKGTDYQFVIRRANPSGATPLKARERFRDRKPADRRADLGFVRALWENFGDQPFERGNLDAGRLSWLFGREVLPAEDPFDPASYDALLVLDVDAARLRGLPRRKRSIRRRLGLRLMVFFSLLFWCRREDCELSKRHLILSYLQQRGKRCIEKPFYIRHGAK